MTELWIVRHGKARRRGPEWPDDRQRPLTAAGRSQAEGLAEQLERMDVRFDRIFSSPWLRAAQTAEPLRAALRRGRRIDVLDELAEGDPWSLLAILRSELGTAAAVAAVVGHEPLLGTFGALLLTGRGDGMSVSFRKGAALVLEGELAAGGMALRAFLPASSVAPGPG